MAAEQIITIVFLIVLGVLLIFLLMPNFIFLCDDLGEFIADFISDVKNAFIEAANKWKYIFKRWMK